MRTNIDIDEALVSEAMTLTGLGSKRAVVEEALRELVRARSQRSAIQAMIGLGWEGDLDALRRVQGE